MIDKIESGTDWLRTVRRLMVLSVDSFEKLQVVTAFSFGGIVINKNGSRFVLLKEACEHSIENVKG